MGVAVRQKRGDWYLFIRHNGERAAKRFKDQDEAETVAKAVRHAITLGQFDLAALKASRQQEVQELQVPTLKEYFDRYEREYLKHGVRANTVVSYRGAFDNHIEPELGALRLTEITRTKVKAFVGVLNRKTYQRTVIEKAKNEKGDIVKKVTVVERPLSKSTLRIITASLRACLNHACDDELIIENPARRLTKMFGQAKHMHEKIEPLAPAEVPLFLQSAKDHAPDYYAMFLTLLHTGVRSGECAGLQWGDLDFAGKFIIVRRTVTAAGKVGPAAIQSKRLPYRIEKTKTDRVRRIDMSDELLATLDLHRKECLKKSLKEAKPLPEWVFANKEGNPLDMHNIKNRVFHPVLAKAKLRRIRMHDLRHSYASLMISAGISPAYVQQQLGHASIKMTVDTYTHLIPGANRDATNVLPGLSGMISKKAAKR